MFEEIKDKEVAYILGFLWADGYFNKKYGKISLEIKNEDLLEILPIFNFAGKWTQQVRKRENRKPEGLLCTTNKHLFELLSKYNYLEKSYFSPNFLLSTLSDELKRYWLRGYFDGDGCFYIHKLRSLYQASFSGSYEQDWTFIEELLSALCIPYKVIQREQIRDNMNSTHSSVVRITSRNNVIKLGEYLYEGKDNIFLTRKKVKFLEIFQTAL